MNGVLVEADVMLGVYEKRWSFRVADSMPSALALVRDCGVALAATLPENYRLARWNLRVFENGIFQKTVSIEEEDRSYMSGRSELAGQELEPGWLVVTERGPFLVVWNRQRKSAKWVDTRLNGQAGNSRGWFTDERYGRTSVEVALAAVEEMEREEHRTAQAVTPAQR